MNHYHRLRIAEHRGKSVVLGTYDGKFYKGLLDIELTNENYEEDNENPALALLIDGNLEEFDWKDIDFIADQSYLYSGEAV